MDNHLQSAHIGAHSFTAQLGSSTITGLDWWTGLVDWTGGLDWWTDNKNHFYASNETYLPVGLHDASY